MSRPRPTPGGSRPDEPAQPTDAAPPPYLGPPPTTPEHQPPFPSLSKSDPGAPFPGSPYPGPPYPGTSAPAGPYPGGQPQFEVPMAPGPDEPAGAALGDLRLAAVITLGLSVLGALLGLVWNAWSPAGPRALVISPGALEVDETEAYAAGDGRFLVLGAVVGLLAGVLAWRFARHRGPVVLASLAVGGVAGSLLMWLVGRVTSSGTTDGKPNTIIDELPLSLHMHGLLFVEAGLAVLVYGMITAFAVRDDLGRDDPAHERLTAARLVPAAPVGGPAPWGSTPPQS